MRSSSASLKSQPSARSNKPPCVWLWTLLLALLLGASGPGLVKDAHALPTPADGIGLLWGSAADTDRPSSIRLNPAGLAFQPAWGFELIHTDMGLPFVGPERGDGTALFVSFKPLPFLGTGLGIQLMYADPADATGARVGTHARLTLSNAVRLGKWISVGFNAHFFLGDKPEVQRLFTMDAGLTFRPFNFLSLGVMVRHLNAPIWDNAFIPRKWEFGLSLRPLLDHRWVISADLQLPEAGQEGLQFLYRTEFVPTRGLALGLRFSHGLDFQSFQGGLFLGLRFGQWGIRTYGQGAFTPQNTSAPAGFGGFFASLWYSGASYGSLIRSKGRMVLFDLGGALPERINAFPLGGVKPLFLRVLQALDRLAQDPSVGGLLLRISSLGCGMAKVQELRAALQRLRSKGKKIVVYLTSASMKSFYLASMADKIYIYPSGSIQFGGLAFRHVFYAGLFEKVGVKAQFVKFGKYKTAPNQYTHKQMTPAHREAYKVLLDDIFGQLMSDVAKSRKKPQKIIQKWLGHGWFTAKEAVKAGMVDGALYWEKVFPQIRESLGGQYWLDTTYFSEQRAPKRWRGRDKIAVIHVDGAIVSGTSLDDPLFGTRLSGAYTIIRHLLRAQYDDSVKAIVLRVDSPGGGVLASDTIWRYVDKLRRFKPVIISMATVAASGGYYIAAPATEIMAMPATITGSIGIYAGKFDFSGVLKKLGINVQVQQRGPIAGIFNPYRPFSQAQRKRLQSYIKAGYEGFLEKVLKGRKKKLTDKKLRSIAAGRVWTGTRAKKLGLVDRIGGLWEAIQRAKTLSAIAQGADIEIVSWPNKGYWRFSPRLALGLKASGPVGPQATQSSHQDPLAQLFGKLQPAPAKALPTGALLLGWIKRWQRLLGRMQKVKLWAMQPFLLQAP